MSEKKKNCGHSIDLICGCVPIQSTEDRTVELFLGALNPFSASGPFQILQKRGDGKSQIRTVKCWCEDSTDKIRGRHHIAGCKIGNRGDEEEPRVSLIYEEWTE